jgi:hypothetical protein
MPGSFGSPELQPGAAPSEAPVPVEVFVTKGGVTKTLTPQQARAVADFPTWATVPDYLLT